MMSPIFQSLRLWLSFVCLAWAALCENESEVEADLQLPAVELMKDAVFASKYRHLWEADGQTAKDVLRLGQFYHANAYFEEALVCYDLVAESEMDEKSIRGRYLAACVSEALGSRQDARKRLSVFIEQGFNYPFARLRLARLLQGRRFEVEALFEQCLNESQTFAAASIGLAKMAMRQGDMKLAREHLLACLNRDPRCGDAALLLANLYAATNEERKAQRYLEIGQGSPRHTSARDPWLDEIQDFRYGSYTLSCDADEKFTAMRFDEARVVLERALDLYPNCSDLWLGMAKLEFALDRREAALQAIESAVACPDVTALAFAIYGEELCRDEDYVKALEQCVEAKTLGFESVRIEILEARIHQQKKDFINARLNLNRAMVRSPQNVSLLEASGDLARQEGNLDLAMDHFSQALRGRPLTSSLYSKLLAVAIEARAWDQAKKALDLLEQRLPEEDTLPRLRAQYWQARALDFEELGQRKEWLASLNQSFASHSDSEDLFKQISARLMKQQEWEALLLLSGSAGEELSGSYFVLKITGLAQLQIGRLEEGVSTLRAARDRAMQQGDLAEANRLGSIIDRLVGEVDSV